MSLATAIYLAERDLLPSEWRVKLIERDGVLWRVVVRHQLHGTELEAVDLGLDNALASVGELAAQAAA